MKSMILVGLMMGKAAGIDAGRAHISIEMRGREIFLEEVAIHIGEAGQFGVEIGGALILGGIQHLEELVYDVPCIGAVGAGFGIEQIPENIARLEDASIVGKEAEDDAGEEDLKLVARVARGLDFIVEMAHEFGGLDVDRVLILELAGLAAKDEGEFLDMLGEVFQRPCRGFP